MKCAVILLAISIVIVIAKPRIKRQAYHLPDGAELIVSPIKQNFVCTDNGYYADVDNGCQIFHVCHTVVRDDGTKEVQQWSFFCGNQTIFDQPTMTCSYLEDAIPCAKAPDFFYLNNKIGDPKAQFIEEQDLEKISPLRPLEQGFDVLSAPQHRPLRS